MHESIRFFMDQHFPAAASRAWIDLAEAYLLACEATGATPIIDNKPRPAKRVLEVTVKVDRLVSDEFSDAENDTEAEQVTSLFHTGNNDGIDVHVVDRNGVYLYTPFGEPK